MRPTPSLSHKSQMENSINTHCALLVLLFIYFLISTIWVKVNGFQQWAPLPGMFEACQWYVGMSNYTIHCSRNARTLYNAGRLLTVGGFVWLLVMELWAPWLHSWQSVTLSRSPCLGFHIRLMEVWHSLKCSRSSAHRRYSLEGKGGLRDERPAARPSAHV